MAALSRSEMMARRNFPINYDVTIMQDGDIVTYSENKSQLFPFFHNLYKKSQVGGL